MKSIYKLSLIGMLALSLPACKKLVDVPAPISSINSQNVYATDPTAIAALSAVYPHFDANSINDNLEATSFKLSLSADELTLQNNSDLVRNFTYANSLTPVTTSDFWTQIYPDIYIINAAIEGISQSSTLTQAVKQQLLGEAKFDRAFCYFHLVNIYGPVVMPLTSDYKVNSVLARIPVRDVYAQIISDLKDAEDKLSSNYLDGTLLATTTERVRPTKWAAAALLAKVYLYNNDYQNAITESSKVIGNTGLFSLVPLDNAFLTTSQEAIWQLELPANNGQDTRVAQIFVVPSTGFGVDIAYSLSPSVLNAFEPGDQRRTHWVGSVQLAGTTYYYPYKYKNNQVSSTIVINEYDTPLRLADQYLIRAEAEANLSQASAAVSDLNQVRNRAGLAGYAGATDAASLQTAILHERQVELFAEWGNRWFDLKRTGTVNSVMAAVTPKKGGTWSAYKAFYPVPIAQMQLDPNLVQTPGY